MFRPRSNPSYFHKGLNDSNCVNNNNNNLLEEMLEILPAKTTLIFLLQTLDFVIKEVTNNSSKRERVSWINDELSNNGFRTMQGKILGYLKVFKF